MSRSRLARAYQNRLDYTKLSSEKASVSKISRSKLYHQPHEPFLKTSTASSMVLFILTETSAGFALLKAKGMLNLTNPQLCVNPTNHSANLPIHSDKKLLQKENLEAETETAEGICSL